VVEGYVAHDLCHRVELDVGKAVHDKAPDPATATSRLSKTSKVSRNTLAASVAAPWRLRRCPRSDRARKNALRPPLRPLRDASGRRRRLRGHRPDPDGTSSRPSKVSRNTLAASVAAPWRLRRCPRSDRARKRRATSTLAASVLRDTFEVFESYLR
jgi:lambda repressor-like predicted transcriptional regulator